MTRREEGCATLSRAMLGNCEWLPLSLSHSRHTNRAMHFPDPDELTPLKFETVVRSWLKSVSADSKEAKVSMAIDQLKFSRFCEDRAEYDSADSFWDDFTTDIVLRTASPERWRLLPRTRTAAGAPWTQDGQCTMLSLLNEARKRWVTLEQFAPSTGMSGVWASVEGFGDPVSGPVLERLRIDCVLSERTENIVKQLLIAFVVDDLPAADMEALIARLGAHRS